MSVYLLALLIGIIAGLRTFTAPAAVAWAAHFGRLDLSGSWLAFFGNVWARWILTALALFELVVDPPPSTARRRVPAQWGGQILAGAPPGAAVGTAGGSW